MSLRYALAFGVLCAFTVPALAEPLKPTVVFTAKPVSQLMGEYREMIRQIGGPSEGDRAVKAFEDWLKESLGEQGFEGIDINRPIAAYTVVNEKFEETNPVLIIPVIGEKDFVAFLKRIKFEANPVKDKKGLYMLRVRGLDFLPNDSFLQFVEGGWAYIGLNGDSIAEEKNRLPVDGLFDNADLSLFSVKLFPGQFPEKLLKKWLEELDASANAVKGFAAVGSPPYLAKFINAIFEEGPKLLRRYGESGIKEVDVIRLKFSWQPMTGDTFTEVELTPKAGSQMAKDIAEKAASTNRFAGFMPKNAAFGVMFKAPLYAKEIREIVGAGVGALEGGLKTDLAEAYHPFLEEIAKSATASVKKGDMDVAVALTGPDKEGKYTLVGGASLTDTAAIDKSLRKLAKSVADPKEFELDAAKVGDVSIHKVPLFKIFSDNQLRELTPAFGEYPPGYIALGKDVGFLSFGPDSLAAIKAAIEAKPGPAPVLELTGNPKRLQKLTTYMWRVEESSAFERLFAADDKQASLLRVSVEGGKTLKAKVTLNVRYFPRLQFLP